MRERKETHWKNSISLNFGDKTKSLTSCSRSVRCCWTFIHPPNERESLKGIFTTRNGDSQVPRLLKLLSPWTRSTPTETSPRREVFSQSCVQHTGEQEIFQTNTQRRRGRVGNPSLCSAERTRLTGDCRLICALKIPSKASTNLYVYNDLYININKSPCKCPWLKNFFFFFFCIAREPTAVCKHTFQERYKTQPIST